MLILLDHRAEVCKVENDLASMLAAKYYRFLVPMGWSENVNKHWHEHYI